MLLSEKQNICSLIITGNNYFLRVYWLAEQTVRVTHSAVVTYFDNNNNGEKPITLDDRDDAGGRDVRAA
jgi:hypothetical protein